MTVPIWLKIRWLLVLGLMLGSPALAQAGLITGDDAVALAASSGAANAPATNPSHWLSARERGPQWMLPAGPTAPTSSSGAGGVSSTGSSAGAHCAILGSVSVTSGQLEARLFSEPTCFLPAPFLDGIFRPPRA